MLRGKRAFNTVISMLKRSSVEDNDLKGRVGKILAQLWSAHQSLPAKREQEPGLQVRTRLGASILHDSLWQWRERFGDQGSRNWLWSSPLHSAEDTLPSPDSACLESASPDTRFSSHQHAGEIDHAPPPNHLQPIQYPKSPRIGPFQAEDDLAPEFDWIWDVGFPSLIPIDIDHNSLSAEADTEVHVVSQSN